MRALALWLILPAVASAAPADPFAGLAFLVGEWTAGSGSGRPGEAVGGGFSLRPDLGGAVLVRRSRAEYAPRPGQARGEVHEDLMVIHREGAALKATYWDGEGHVIRYAVATEPGRATFESEPGPGPRFRLVYEEKGEGEVSIAFLIAPPGKEFQPYVTGTARRK